MPKYKPEIAENLRQAILDCSIRRLTLAETRQYLIERVGVEMNMQVISRYRAQLRQSAQRWIAKLAKSNKGDYIAEYRERIQEVYGLQKRLWEIVNNERSGPHNQIEALGKLLDCTKQLVALYDCLPLVNAIRDYDQGKEYSPMTHYYDRDRKV